jgi:hypothetical protein
MKKDCNRLLINKNIIPNTAADWQTTSFDVVMMTIFASKKRTMSEWQKLLKIPEFRAKIPHVWSAKHSQERLIECELARDVSRSGLG